MYKETRKSKRRLWY